MWNVHPIPALSDNYIWLLHSGKSAVVVDPGTARPVTSTLQRQGLTLTAILLTHHHADHQGGAKELRTLSGARVYGTASPHSPFVTDVLKGGETLALSDPAVRFQVLSVPGHTRDHLAFYTEGILFCGDTLFSAGCGRLLGGSAAEMAASLGLLASLPDETKVYAAHEYTRENLRFALLVEPENVLLRHMTEEAGRHHLSTLPSTIGQEKAINPFLRCSEPAVLQAARRRDARARDPVSVFAALRAWKDEF